MSAKHARYGIQVLMAMLVSACGGSDDGGAPQAVVAVAGKASITAAAGGTVTDGTGGATLVFPANAVSADTEVTVAEQTGLPATPRLVPGTTYEFGPSMTFAKPVQAIIRYDPSKLPPGALENQLKMYKQVRTAWQPVAGSTVDTSARTVSAALNGFSHYGILADNQFAGAYSGTYSGGETGTWSATINVDGSIDAAASGDFVGKGSVDFNGTSTIPLSGSGRSEGFHVTFNGNFVLQSSGMVAGSGSWASSSGLSGSWIGSRKN